MSYWQEAKGSTPPTRGAKKKVANVLSCARACSGKGFYVRAFDPDSVRFEAKIKKPEKNLPGHWITAEQTALRFVCHLDGVTVSCFSQFAFPSLPRLSPPHRSTMATLPEHMWRIMIGRTVTNASSALIQKTDVTARRIHAEFVMGWFTKQRGSKLPTAAGLADCDWHADSQHRWDEIIKRACKHQIAWDQTYLEEDVVVETTATCCSWHTALVSMMVTGGAQVLPDKPSDVIHI